MLSLPKLPKLPDMSKVDLSPVHFAQRQQSNVMHVAEHVAAASVSMKDAAVARDGAARLDAFVAAYDELEHAMDDAHAVPGVGLLTGDVGDWHKLARMGIDELNKVVPRARERRGAGEITQSTKAFDRGLELYGDGTVGYTDRARAIGMIDHAREDAKLGLDLLKQPDTLRDPLLGGLGTLDQSMRDARPLDQTAVSQLRDLYAAAAAAGAAAIEPAAA